MDVEDFACNRTQSVLNRFFYSNVVSRCSKSSSFNLHKAEPSITYRWGDILCARYAYFSSKTCFFREKIIFFRVLWRFLTTTNWLLMTFCPIQIWFMSFITTRWQIIFCQGGTAIILNRTTNEFYTKWKPVKNGI